MDSVTSASAATAATSSTKAEEIKSKNAMISSDFETFLKMLTVQMENQDPLNPMESSDYAVQLATFSGVEQQVQTNDLLETLAENFGGAGLAQYGGWVGMEARAAVAATFDGSPVTVLPSPDSDADSAKLVVRNSSGAEVQRMSIDTGGEAVEWAGVDPDGQPFPADSYRFIVENYKDGARISESQAEVYATVAEVRSGSDGIMLVFDSGGEAGAGAIGALRQARD